MVDRFHTFPKDIDSLKITVINFMGLSFITFTLWRKMMKLGYVLLYVEDVTKTIEFYEKAFGLKRGFVCDSNAFGEMETGFTKLGFVSISLAKESHLTFTTVRPGETPPGIEVGFVTENVEESFQKSLQAGAFEVCRPIQKPWGQIVSYVRDCNGFLVEICSPMR